MFVVGVVRADAEGGGEHGPEASRGAVGEEEGEGHLVEGGEEGEARVDCG